MKPLKKSCRTHMKMQKFVTIVKKNLKINISKKNKISDHCHYTGECRGAAHSIYNLIYRAPKKISYSFS